MSAEPTEANVGTIKNQNLGYRIIMTGFGIIGALAALYLYTAGATAAETLIASAVTGFFGFLAGRKA